jgi:hypothetical protein
MDYRPGILPTSKNQTRTRTNSIIREHCLALVNLNYLASRKLLMENPGQDQEEKEEKREREEKTGQSNTHKFSSTQHKFSPSREKEAGAPVRSLPKHKQQPGRVWKV